VVGTLGTKAGRDSSDEPAEGHPNRHGRVADPGGSRGLAR